MIEVGHVEIAERTFSVADVEAFTVVSGDRGRHHVEKDAHGRLMVQGLLTGSVFTEIGGRLDYIARDMRFEFVRPVYSGDTVRVELVVESVEDQGTRLAVSARALWTNQHGKEVMKATTSGIILK